MQPLAIVALGALALLVYLAEKGKAARPVQTDAPPSSPVVLVVQGGAASSAPTSSPAPVALQRAPTSIPTSERKQGVLGNPFAQVGLDVAAPFGGQIVGGAISETGAGVARVSNPFGGAPTAGQSGLPAVGNTVADELGSAGASVSSSAGLGLAGLFVAKAAPKIRGGTEEEKRKAFGAASLSTVQTGVALAVPFFGSVASSLLGVAARTHEGGRAVKAVGTTVTQGYEGQKKLLAGDFTGTKGAKDKRQNAFFMSVDARVNELKEGGKLDEKDVSGFKQALGYGYTLSGGFDLSTLDLKAGTNPFRKA